MSVLNKYPNKVREAAADAVDEIPPFCSESELQHSLACTFVRHGLSAVEVEQAMDIVNDWRTNG